MSDNKILLGVNIDHVATVRQARGTAYPSVVDAAIEAEAAGADGITIHLREDRRHIQDDDVQQLKEVLMTRMNLEISINKEIVRFATLIRPAYCCLVPEKREELTTEGGLDVTGQRSRIQGACYELKQAGIAVSLFVNPNVDELESILACQAPIIEIHTGHYADAKTKEQRTYELKRIQETAEQAKKAGLQINAGHGLHYENVQLIAQIPQITELNIGHSIISKSIFVGLRHAVKEMKQLMLDAR